jgi:hypothetical protein
MSLAETREQGGWCYEFVLYLISTDLSTTEKQCLQLVWALFLSSNRSGFSRRLAALTNATEIGTGRDSKTQKSPDLARRKAIGWNTVLERAGFRY